VHSQPPPKPYPDFPLFAHKGGQWRKDVRVNGGKPQPFYFGPWKDDRNGQRAIKDWLARQDAIRAGIDNPRVPAAPASITVGDLMRRFLAAKRLQVQGRELSATTLGDYLRELQRFVSFVGTDAQVTAIKPQHFAAYAQRLIEHKQGRHARKRVVAYIKAMFHWGAKNAFYPQPTFGTEFVAPDTSPDAMRQDKAREGKKDYSKRVVTGEEIDRLLERANPAFRAITLLGVNCGLGPADIGRLRWDHLNLETGELNMPRGKTGTERRGYLWRRTREALARAAKLKHTKLAIESLGQTAFCFYSRKGLPMYREEEVVKDGRVTGVKASNAISITFSRMAQELKLQGVTFYRLRHTFKTFGKKAKDRDALNLCMGHRDGTTGEVYDHEVIDFKRVKQVAMAVKRGLWPKAKRVAGKTGRPQMRIVGGDAAEAA
jgi:integrase